MFTYRLYKHAIDKNRWVYVLLDRHDKIVRGQLMNKASREVISLFDCSTVLILDAAIDVMRQVFDGEPAIAVFVDKTPDTVPMPYFRKQA